MFNKRVYLDYAAATPLDKKIFQKMKKYFYLNFQNAQALYQSALKVKKDFDLARNDVARICGVKNKEVIFTTSGTESNNLAILGIVRAFQKKYPNLKPKIISTIIEHPSILEPLKFLENSGIEINYLKVNSQGEINIEDFAKALDENVVVVTMMYANNEIGSILPIRKISGLIKKFKNKIQRMDHEFPYLHTDACQAPNFLNINVNALGVDLMTLDGSKIYGPKGVGVLIKKSFVPLEKIYYGGNQEFGIKPGTENIPLIIGFAEALKLSVKNLDREFQRVTKLRNYFVENFLKIFPEAILNGSLKNRLPNNINFCIKGLNAEFAVIKLGLHGVELSSATTCKNISEETRSYVVDALGQNCGASSLRFTLGKYTKKTDLDFVLKKLKDIIPEIVK